MKLLLLPLLFLNVFLLFPQDEVLLEHSEAYNPAKTDALLRDLNEENDYVISFRIRNTGKADERTNRYILTKAGKQFAAYQILGSRNERQKIDLPQESMSLAWKTFVQNDLFRMRTEKDIANFCAEKYNIFDSYTYEFLILSKGRMKSLAYYNPEYYDVACYGMAERQKIINSVAVIHSIFSK